MYLENKFSHRYKLETLLGKTKYDLISNSYIEFDEEKMEWWITADHQWLYREPPVLSTIDEVEKIIKNNTRKNKLDSL